MTLNKVGCMLSRLNTPRIVSLSRRRFLQLTGVAGGGLMLACHNGASRSVSGAEFSPNIFVRISEEGTVIILAKNPEIGQGVKTALPMIVAEELDVAWDQVRVEQAPVDDATFKAQWAGGSMSVASAWNELRFAGAVARAMLIVAAANRWSVEPADCKTVDGSVLHEASGRRLDYGALVNEAASLPAPSTEDVTLKSSDQFRLLGRRITGVDNLDIVTGRPLFGVDHRQEGMVYAVYQKCPAFGGSVINANLDEIKGLPGIIDAFVINRRVEFGPPLHGVAILKPGVAIVATSTWAAFSAKRRLKVRWDETNASKDNWAAQQEEARQLGQREGETVIASNGAVEQAFADAAKMVSGFYAYPYLSHAQLEPQNCTARYRDGKFEFWAPTQSGQWAKQAVSTTTGVARENIKIHQTRVGGGFGRRLINDFMCEAAEVAMRVDGPVKLMWTREDDMTDDYYRVGGFHMLQGALDADNKLSGWRNHFITFTIDGEEPATGGGIKSTEFPGPLVGNYKLSRTMIPSKIPGGWWRAPETNGIAFAVQSFIHELAVAARRDHVEFLLEIMGEPRWIEPGQPYALNTERAAGVIKLAAEKSGWGKTMPEGRGLGLAFNFSEAGHFAEVAEVSVDARKRVRVHKVTVAGDVGPIVNLSGAENQCEGCVIDGLSAMAAQQVSFENGRVKESNFGDYTLLRLPQAPEIDIHFIQSEFSPTGLGEPALPPVAPAICNAIYAAAGVRVRELPLTKAGFKI